MGIFQKTRRTDGNRTFDNIEKRHQVFNQTGGKAGTQEIFQDRFVIHITQCDWIQFVCLHKFVEDVCTDHDRLRNGHSKVIVFQLGITLYHRPNKRQAPAPVKEAPKKEAVKKETERKSAPRQAETARRSEPREEREVVQRTDEEIAQIKATALEFLSGVFKAMELPVEIQMEYNAENGSLEVDFAGEDMGILIGKRGQTLDSLQYLTSLVVNKEQKDYVRVKLDTENYRKRRKETLENLARNIAYKVKKTRRPVSLEPMNPYERRIIHSALQGNKFVETYSEGSEPYRHVVVAPKR